MGRPKNFDDTIERLEKSETKDGGFRARIQSELEDLEATINKFKPHVEEFAAKAGEEAHKAKRRVEGEVQKNPWATIGIVGLIFFVLGFLFASKKSGRQD